MIPRSTKRSTADVWLGDRRCQRLSSLLVFGDRPDCRLGGPASDCELERQDCPAWHFAKPVLNSATPRRSGGDDRGELFPESPPEGRYGSRCVPSGRHNEYLSCPGPNYVVDGVCCVANGGSCIGIDHEFTVEPGPSCGHEFCFGSCPWHAGPTRENDNVVFGCDRCGVGEAFSTDWMEFAPATIGVAQHDDQPLPGSGHDRRRRRLKNSNVAITVVTSPTAFLPWSFDSPPARGRMWTATSST